MNIDATNGNLDAKWYHLYCSVQRCNSALRVLNATTDSQVKNRAIRIAEVRFLRAHYYFELSRMYNKIVYFDENYTDDITKLSNNEYTRDQILEKIDSEIAAAVAVLPETQSEIGRINKYIALAYEAKVDLYRAYKQDETTHKVISIDGTLMNKVVSLCDQVINSRKYDLMENFQDLDKVSTGDNCKEGVFQIEYSMNDGSGSAGRVNWSNLLNAPQGPYSGDGFFLPSQDLVDAFQTDANGLPLFDSYYMDRNQSGKTSFNSDFPAITTTPTSVQKKMQLRVFVDKMSIEAFDGNGRFAMTNLVFPSEPYNQINFFANGKNSIKSLVVYNLK